jgi:hypothetical protein
VATYSEDYSDPLLAWGHYEVTVTGLGQLASQKSFGEDITQGIRRSLIDDWLLHLRSYRAAVPSDHLLRAVSGLLVRTEFLTASSVEPRPVGPGPFLPLAEVIEWAIEDLTDEIES